MDGVAGRVGEFGNPSLGGVFSAVAGACGLEEFKIRMKSGSGAWLTDVSSY